MSCYSDYYRNENMEDMYLNCPAPPVDTPAQAATRAGLALTMALVPKAEVPFGPLRGRLTSILMGRNGAVLRNQVREVYRRPAPATDSLAAAAASAPFTPPIG